MTFAPSMRQSPPNIALPDIVRMPACSHRCSAFFVLATPSHHREEAGAWYPAGEDWTRLAGHRTDKRPRTSGVTVKKPSCGKKGLGLQWETYPVTSLYFSYQFYRRCPTLIPKLKAFWRIAPAVPFISFEILTTGVFFFE